MRYGSLIIGSCIASYLLDVSFFVCTMKYKRIIFFSSTSEQLEDFSSFAFQLIAMCDLSADLGNAVSQPSC